jgi:hypothetical protein
LAHLAESALACVSRRIKSLDAQTFDGAEMFDIGGEQWDCADAPNRDLL